MDLAAMAAARLKPFMPPMGGTGVGRGEFRAYRALARPAIALDRSAEAIAVYDDLLARFGNAAELPLP